MQLLTLSLAGCVMLAAFSPVAGAAINEKARQDFDAGRQKARQADKLFGEKKWGEAADAFQSAIRGMALGVKRDPQLDTMITVTYSDLQNASDYGYTFGTSFQSEDGGRTAQVGQTYYRRILRQMGGDAAIMAGRPTGMMGIGEDDDTQDITQYNIETFLEKVAEGVHKIDPPVPDDELAQTVSLLRRALLQLEAMKALKPELTAKPDPHYSPRGGEKDLSPDDVAREAKAKLDEILPDYEKVVAAQASADPKDYTQTLEYDLSALDGALAGVKKNGWVKWDWVRDLYVSKDYLAGRRKLYSDFYKKEGKEFPADKLKPLEEKMKTLRAAMEGAAPKWGFPTGLTHDPAIEARVKTAVKGLIPGVTIYKTALAGGWNTETNEIGIPQWRNRGAYVLLKKPGETWAWLVLGEYREGYAGGGRYNAGRGRYNAGRFEPPFMEARLQKAP